MSTLITITLYNKSTQFHNFYFFQKPAIYVGGQTPYTNSLYSTALYPFNDPVHGGSSSTFFANIQYVAGVQQSNNAIPQVGQTSGFNTAVQNIDLTLASGSPTNNSTNMSIANNSLGLSTPSYTPGVQAGAFRIVTPTYQATATNYFAGSAVLVNNNQPVLSNFVLASPNSNIDAQPILKYYIAVGDYTAGTVMNFTTSSAQSATCDATGGQLNFSVSYNSDGTWSYS